MNSNPSISRFLSWGVTGELQLSRCFVLPISGEVKISSGFSASVLFKYETNWEITFLQGKALETKLNEKKHRVKMYLFMSDTKCCLRFWGAVLAVVAKRLCHEWSCCSCFWFFLCLSLYLLSSFVCMFWFLLRRSKVLSKVCDLKTVLVHCLVTKEGGPWRVGYRLQKRMWGKQPPLSFQCSLAGWWKGGREVCWWI